MTSQTGRNRYGWPRTATVGALALGLLLGAGSAIALADPAAPTDQTEAAAPPTTAEEVLAIIAKDYDTGAGGGQLSKLIHQVMRLRAQGYMPSNSNKKAIVKALDYRPNQAPLIKALEQTLVYQRGLQARAAAAQQSPGAQGPFTVGVNPMPTGAPPGPTSPGNAGVVLGPTGGAQQPVG